MKQQFIVECLKSSHWAFKLSEREVLKIFQILKAMPLI